MPLRSAPSEDGFSIRGASPKDINAFPGGAMLWWGWVLELSLKAKDRDLAAGLDKDGKPLRPISVATRKHRVSAMTPGGRGDPSAPPLEPGRQKSRTRSLLTGRAFNDHIDMWWKFDPWTGDSWARILEFQAAEGRDVFGLSPESLARVERTALERWKKWTAGKPVAAPILPIPAEPLALIPSVGAMDFRLATMGIGGVAPEKMVRGYFTGGKTLRGLTEHLRTPARVTIPGRPKGEYNVLLREIWGAQGKLPGPPRRAPIPVVPPKPKPITRVALGPKPIVQPKPLVIVTPAQQSAFRADVLAAAHQVEQFYEGKVFIHHVWAELIKDPRYADLTLDQFKELLASDQAFRALMARIDLRGAIKEADIAAAQVEIKSGVSGKTMAEYHFIRVARKR